MNMEIFGNRSRRWLEILLDRTPRHNLAAISRRIKNHPRTQRDLKTVEPCIFTLSTGRVGTKTLAELGNLCSNVLAYHEPAPRLFRLSKYAYQCSGDDQFRTILQEAVHVARHELLTYSVYCDVGYLETSPQVTFLAPIIQKLWPQAKFIHLIRAPQDVIRSGMKRDWYAGGVADPTRITPLHRPDFFDAWPNYSPLQKNLWLWAETNRWISEFCSTLPANKTLLLRSEDIFNHEIKALEQFYRFSGNDLPSTQALEKILAKQLNRQVGGEFSEQAYRRDDWGNELREFVSDTANLLGYDLR